ncbi:MAG TPA: LysR family transcriptional regulator [Solirubrobacteraceae bacterium]|jgi:DNA-binding transcriptional LysR family regulator
MSLTDDPVDPRNLRALVAVAEGGSFRSAAQMLGYTQSAISHQIATLEKRLGTTLFVRPGGRRKVELTPLGQLAFQHAQRVLAANRALEGDVTAALAGKRGTLRIGTSASTSHLLAKPLAELGRHSPGVEVSLSNVATAEALAHQLDRGQLDIGLYINIEADERVVTTTLFEDTWMVIAHRTNPLAAEAAIALDALDGVDMIAWHARWRAQTHLEQLWRRRRIRPRIIYRTDDNLMIQQLVANRLGCACLGALTVEHLIDPDIRRIPINDELPPRTLALCHGRGRELTPAAAVVIDAIRAASQRSPYNRERVAR